MSVAKGNTSLICPWAMLNYTATYCTLKIKAKYKLK